MNIRFYINTCAEESKTVARRAFAYTCINACMFQDCLLDPLGAAAAAHLLALPPRIERQRSCRGEEGT